MLVSANCDNLAVGCLHGSQERDKTIQGQQGGRCHAGQVDQCGYTKQVSARAGAEGALTMLNRWKKFGLMPKDDFIRFLL